MIITYTFLHVDDFFFSLIYFLTCNHDHFTDQKDQIEVLGNTLIKMKTLVNGWVNLTYLFQTKISLIFY